jgi:PKD repeat protein
VKATVRSASGSVAILNKIVRVTNPLEIRDLAFEGEPPVKSFSVEGHVPLTVDITPTTFQPLITFSWDAPSATESQITDKHFHAIYRDTGKYYVDLIGVDPDQNVFRRRITVNALPPESVVAFSMDPAAPTAPATVKFDASDSFVAAGEEITGFEWDFGDGLSGDKTKFLKHKNQTKHKQSKHKTKTDLSKHLCLGSWNLCFFWFLCFWFCDFSGILPRLKRSGIVGVL